jgi:hypothetical protein
MIKMNKRLETILSRPIIGHTIVGSEYHNPASKKFHRDTCTLWYNMRNGTIYGIGDSNPKRDPTTGALILCYDSHGPKPELAENIEITKPITKVLDTIRQYRKEHSLE